MVKRVLSLKSCPRCNGDLYAASDMYGSYAQCIQCGYMKDLEKAVASSAVAVADKAKVRAA